VIADPQPLFGRCLATALARHPGIEVAGWAADQASAERLMDLHRPDVLLTETHLAPGSGLRLAGRARGETNGVILSRRDESDTVVDAVRSGALGCLGHRLGVTALAELVAGWRPGRFLVDPARLHELLRQLTTPERHPARPEISHLTPREREVLKLIARGLDDRSIAEHLHLSRHTVRTHVGSILRKLEVHTRADAARLALRAEEQVDRVLRIHGPDLEPS
jgi:DNA-binding NarL/FixJ family response regulator